MIRLIFTKVNHMSILLTPMVSRRLPFARSFLVCFLLCDMSLTEIGAQPLASPQVQDYFESPHEKTYHRQKVITTMKREVNSYSERLHDLQNRFYKIFYGHEGSASFNAPFNNPEDPQFLPLHQSEPKGTYVSPKDSAPVVEAPEQKLAFEVDVSKGEIPESGTLAHDRFLGSGRGYWIIRSGLTLPYQTQRGSFGGAEKNRKYKPGILLQAIGGFTHENFRFGLGLHYRRNSFHSSSYVGSPSNVLGSDKGANTLGSFLDFGYKYPLLNSFDLMISFGLGYGVTIVQDSVSGDSRYDPTFLLSPGVGGKWNFSDRFSLDFGYRFLREDEVPVHVFEIGLAGQI